MTRPKAASLHVSHGWEEASEALREVELGLIRRARLSLREGVEAVRGHLAEHSDERLRALLIVCDFRSMHHRWYHTYMERTTVYLPADLKEAVAREARHRGIAEAEVIREAIAAAVSRPAPRADLFASDEAFADRADELLAGFGDR